MRCRSLMLLVCLLPVVRLPTVAAGEDAALPVLNLNSPLALDTAIAQFATKRVIFVGETHERYDHHLNQLDVIRRLHQLDANLAIGVEYVEQHFQPQLDDYTSGRITEQDFLRAVDYFRTWGYDYRLYAPIFRYAREQHIPVRALNVPNGLASAVAKAGLAGLPQQQRDLLPRDIQPADEAYRARLRSVFEEHPGAKPGDFDHFVEAQLVWDEGMAQNAARYLSENPGRRMVILAGAGHVVFGSGIPSRLRRRTNLEYAVVLSSGVDVEPGIADFILLRKEEKLPPAGVLGAVLMEKGGECQIRSLSPSGGAERAGLKRGDAILEVGGQPVKTVSDVRLALWDKSPGDRVRVTVHHGRDRHDLDVVLTAAPRGLTRP